VFTTRRQAKKKGPQNPKQRCLLIKRQNLNNGKATIALCLFYWFNCFILERLRGIRTPILIMGGPDLIADVCGKKNGPFGRRV